MCQLLPLGRSCQRHYTVRGGKEGKNPGERGAGKERVWSKIPKVMGTGRNRKNFALRKGRELGSKIYRKREVQTSLSPPLPLTIHRSLLSCVTIIRQEYIIFWVESQICHSSKGRTEHKERETTSFTSSSLPSTYGPSLGCSRTFKFCWGSFFNFCGLNRSRTCSL